jgi:hypothetical protein
MDNAVSDHGALPAPASTRVGILWAGLVNLHRKVVRQQTSDKGLCSSLEPFFVTFYYLFGCFSRRKPSRCSVSLVMNPKSGKVLPSSSTTKALTISVEPVVGSADADYGITKIEKSNTELPIAGAQHRRGPGRPPRPTPAPATWSVRGVTPETRLTLEQAARRAGKTLGQYLNEEVHQFAAQQLQPAPAPAVPPATTDLQAQVHYLRQLVENLAAMLDNQPPPAPPSEL